MRRHGPSGAQNLSGWSEFLPGHWALSLQKLVLLRFRFRAWVFLANAPDANDAGRSGTGPYGVSGSGL